MYVTVNVDPMDGNAQIGFHNESGVGKARVHARRLAKANRLMCLDRFVIWEGGIGERHKQSTEQNTKTKNTNLISNKTQPRWTQTQ
jgi:hypothetical protein